MMKIWIKYGLFLFSVMVFTACEVDTQKYPPEPHIEHKESVASVGTDILGNAVKKVELHFYVIDGDGNIGLEPGDTVFPYVGDSSANFFPTLHVYKNNAFVVDTSFTFDRYRIPSVGELGQDKTLKADVYVEMELVDFLVPYDTILYSYYIWDKDFNASNKVYSDTIVFLEN